jgi:ABC-type branched-subunit amino acid transport system substrate-binding protein
MSLVVILAIMGLVTAACGSSKKAATTSPTNSTAPAGSTAGTATGSAGTAASAAPSGSPIKVMTIASVNYSGPNYENILETAKLYQDWVNAHGGIKGHPLQVSTCDEQGDPTKTAQCGRQAIANHDVAVVGSFSFNGNAIVPELAANHISWFGICCAVASDELTGTNVQQIGGDAGIAGLAVKASVDGCKKIALVALDVGAEEKFWETLVNNALKSVNGAPVVKVVKVPLTAQDYAAEVTQATTGTDCIEAILAQANWPSFIPSYKASGAHQRLYGIQGNLDVTITKPNPDVTKGSIVIGVYSDISLPAWNDYRAAISQYHAPTNINYNSLGGLGTWAAYAAFNNIVSSLSGPITASNFLAAAQKASINLNGMTAGGIDFANRWHGLGNQFLNEVNRGVTFDTVNASGELIPFDTGKFFDMTNAMVGQPLSAANTPPAGQ